MKKVDETGVTNETEQEDSRQPYEPPRMEVEELFEVVALSCGKIRPTRASCVRVPRVS